MEGNIYPGMDSHNLEFHQNPFDPTLIDSLEFGRESLGLLPTDFGRESMGFSNPVHLNELEKDTLGLINNLEFSRDSLLPSDKRESLGILHISTYETNSKTPDILLTTISEHENESVCDLLNKAFLFPSPRKYSLPSSCSNLSFNVNSIEEPSKIFSIPSPCDDVFSNSAINSASLYSNQENILCSSKAYERLRIKSLPNVMKSYNIGHFKSKILDGGQSSIIDSVTSVLNKGKLIDSSELSLSESLLNRDQDKKLQDNQKEKLGTENIGHDSIFIEGKYFANKIADGSILNDSFENEVGILDNVPHPHWPDFPVSPEKIGENLNGNAISTSCGEIEVALGRNLESICPEESSEKKPNFIKEDKLDPETDSNLVISKINNTPKSAKELLNNLSEILNTTTRSDQQRSEGQHLLNSLAELLNDGSNIRNSNLDDSGHSSFVNDFSDPEKITNDYYEILDFNQKSRLESGSGNCSIDNLHLKEKISKLNDVNSNRLSLSLNSALPAKIGRPKILNRGNLSRISLDNSKNRTGSSNSSIKSDNLSTGNGLVPPVHTNLKVKTNTESSRKGPLKAMIPVKEFKKSVKPGTPDRTENPASLLQSKRTSTPINEPKLKPMAASTPTQRPLVRRNSLEINEGKSLPSTSKGAVRNGNSAIKSHIQSAGSNINTLNALKRRSLPQSTSPLARTSRKQADVTPSFAKSPKISHHSPQEKSIIQKQPTTPQDNANGKRRNSISALKKEQLSGRPRSNSLPKEPVGIMSSISRIRENLLNSPDFKNLSNQSLLKENNTIIEVERNGNKSKLGMTRRDSISKFKKVGKENLDK